MHRGPPSQNFGQAVTQPANPTTPHAAHVHTDSLQRKGQSIVRVAFVIDDRESTCPRLTSGIHPQARARERISVRGEGLLGVLHVFHDKYGAAVGGQSFPRAAEPRRAPHRLPGYYTQTHAQSDTDKRRDDGFVPLGLFAARHSPAVA